MPDQSDPTLDRLLRHMAWANAALFDHLAALPDDALDLRAPRNDWSAARTAAHLVSAAGRYAARLDGAAFPPEAEVPASAADVRALADACAGYDARLRAAAASPEAVVEGGSGRPPRARSTVLAQSIHHATEHRAQIAGALSTNGIDVIDLDALDLWSYGDAEGLGA
jgi:uncharacterized damage-inducible protein DinB